MAMAVVIDISSFAYSGYGNRGSQPWLDVLGAGRNSRDNAPRGARMGADDE